MIRAPAVAVKSSRNAAGRTDDEMIDDSPGYATIRDHSLDFYQLVYRLVATGQKVATVARSVNAHGKVSYRLSEKFGEGGTPA